MDVLARLPTTRAALEYAEAQHAGQRRSADGAPFILHPIEVGTLLYRAGAPDHVIAAGVLHDTVEKTSADAAELRKRFGVRIARLVLAVSENQDMRGYHARKAALRRQVSAAGEEALMVFAADKISKARELKVTPARDGRSRPGVPAARRRRKLIHYDRCAALLEDQLADSPLVTQLRSELKELEGTHASHPVRSGAG